MTTTKWKRTAGSVLIATTTIAVVTAMFYTLGWIAGLVLLGIWTVAAAWTLLILWLFLS